MTPAAITFSLRNSGTLEFPAGALAGDFQAELGIGRDFQGILKTPIPMSSLIVVGHRPWSAELR